MRAHDDLLAELPFSAEVCQWHVPEHLFSLRGRVLPVILRRDERQPLVPVAKQILIFYTRNRFRVRIHWGREWVRAWIWLRYCILLFLSNFYSDPIFQRPIIPVLSPASTIPLVNSDSGCTGTVNGSGALIWLRYCILLFLSNFY
jgi:hypothetical protein